MTHLAATTAHDGRDRTHALDPAAPGITLCGITHGTRPTGRPFTRDGDVCARCTNVLDKPAQPLGNPIPVSFGEIPRRLRARLGIRWGAICADCRLGIGVRVADLPTSKPPTIYGLPWTHRETGRRECRPHQLDLLAAQDWVL